MTTMLSSHAFSLVAQHAGFVYAPFIIDIRCRNTGIGLANRFVRLKILFSDIFMIVA